MFNSHCDQREAGDRQLMLWNNKRVAEKSIRRYVLHSAQLPLFFHVSDPPSVASMPTKESNTALNPFHFDFGLTKIAIFQGFENLVCPHCLENKIAWNDGRKPCCQDVWKIFPYILKWLWCKNCLLVLMAAKWLIDCIQCLGKISLLLERLGRKRVL